MLRPGQAAAPLLRRVQCTMRGLAFG